MCRGIKPPRTLTHVHTLLWSFRCRIDDICVQKETPKEELCRKIQQRHDKRVIAQCSGVLACVRMCALVVAQRVDIPATTSNKEKGNANHSEPLFSKQAMDFMHFIWIFVGDFFLMENKKNIGGGNIGKRGNERKEMFPFHSAGHPF